MIYLFKYTEFNFDAIKTTPSRTWTIYLELGPNINRPIWDVINNLKIEMVFIWKIGENNHCQTIKILKYKS